MSPDAAFKLLFSLDAKLRQLGVATAIIAGTVGAVACLYFASEYVSETRKSLARRRVKHVFKGDINDESRTPIVLSPGTRWPPPRDLLVNLRWELPSDARETNAVTESENRARDAPAPLSVLYPQELAALTSNPWDEPAMPEWSIPQRNEPPAPQIVVTASEQSSHDSPLYGGSVYTHRLWNAPPGPPAEGASSTDADTHDADDADEQQRSLAASEAPAAEPSPFMDEDVTRDTPEFKSFVEDLDMSASQFHFPDMNARAIYLTPTAPSSPVWLSRDSSLRTLSDISDLVSPAESSPLSDDLHRADSASSLPSDTDTDALSETEDQQSTAAPADDTPRDWTHLPERVLARIFLLGPAAEGWRHVVGASHVCHAWRAAALREPRLWACIPLRSSGATPVFLARCHTASAALDPVGTADVRERRALGWVMENWAEMVAGGRRSCQI